MEFEEGFVGGDEKMLSPGVQRVQWLRMVVGFVILEEVSINNP